ncbi:hypothetical protein C0Q70_07234 [Pomacea canaliculata]|uniref:Polysaccharide pyruvyl transferase domain-containing protein n=1 Tax=Pomacea canaliculata TaxID=400727 RepID=A0A2T7PEH6_POMCA|nr:hypothetical protein C0Q70_07234 [Pomacea canaliculata]
MGSNVLLAVRNLAIKGLHSGQLNLGPRRLSWSVGGVLVGMSVLVLTAVWWLEIVDIVSRRSTLAVTSLLLSGVFHVTYSLISTSVILRALDVVSHSMANVIKRVLVVALLYVSGSRSASGANVAGLMVTIAGLAVYVRDKTHSKTNTGSKQPVQHPNQGAVCHVSHTSYWLAPFWYHHVDIDNMRRQVLTGFDGQDATTTSCCLSQWADFLSLDYTRHPFDTDRLAPTLHTNDEVVWEMQRLHVRVLTSLLAGRRHAMLMEFAAHENKGDAAITVGQVALLKRLNGETDHLLADRQSGSGARTFSRDETLLMPDMAFGLGRVPRTMPPTLDIVWLKRTDRESSGYKVPEIPTNLSVYVGDWREWKTNHGKTPMETSFLMAFNGLSFLQRGRVVITDRLHGHILSVLLGIPHVLIDNPPYFNSLPSVARGRRVIQPVLVTTGRRLWTRHKDC